MLNMDGYRRALSALDAGITFAEVNGHENESLLISVVSGEINRTAANSQTALYVRACGEKIGIAYTQDILEDPAQVIRRAVENGRYGEGTGGHVLAEPRVSHAIKAYPEADIQAMKEAGDELNALAREQDACIVHAASEVRMDTAYSAVLNSRGLFVNLSRRVFCAKVSVMAQKDGRQYNAQAHVTAGKLNDLKLMDAAKRAAQSLKSQYSPRDIKSASYPVVLDSSVVINIMTTAWQLFSGAKMINGSSALHGCMGKQIGSAALSITDRTARLGCGYTFFLDDEGVEGRDTPIMSSGVLEGLLHTQFTAARYGDKPAGNSGRVALLTGSIPTELIPVPKVFCVEPGESSLDTLLQNMNNGVYISQSYDVFHSINIGSGDFSIPCRGSVVKDGQCVYNVTGMTICGNVKDLFSKVLAAGSDLWIDEFLLKSYCIGAPSLLVSSLQVNGKG